MKVKWTKCTDRLPKIVDRYLVMSLGGQILVDLRTPGAPNDFSRYWVTHWAELPKPYYRYAPDDYLKKYPWICSLNEIYNLIVNGNKRYFTCNSAGIVGYAEIVLPKGTNELYLKEVFNKNDIVAVILIEL